ncbi:stage III sporulation protein AE [Clostridiales bacterium]|nr:stage III sporulation protein AE [Clostridiales bacterium]
MIKKILIAVLLVLIFIFPQKVYAEDTTIESVADMFGLEEADRGLSQIGADYGMEDFSLKETALKLVTGEFDFSFSGFIKWIVRLAAGQAADVMYIMRRILILILLSAVLETVSSSFLSSGVSNMGQYVCSSVLVITVMQSFYYASETVTSAMDKITQLSTTLQPIYMLIMTANGKAAKMSAAVPVMYASASILNYMVKRLIVPCVLLAALITFINSMSERDVFMELADLLSCLCKWGVKLCAGGFIFVMSLIKIGVPDMAVIAGKSIKTAAEAVPVVGSLMSSAAETAASLASSMGNSVTAAIMLFIVLMSIMPVVRLSVIMIIYKLTAALTEPIASKRIVKCIGRAADYTAILTGIIFTAEVMFITVTALMLAV